MCDGLTNGSWQRVRVIIRRRDGETCQYCGELAPDGEPDHVLPLGRGGTDALHNLVWACQNCNREKHDKTPREWVRDLCAGPRRAALDNLLPRPERTEKIAKMLREWWRDLCASSDDLPPGLETNAKINESLGSLAYTLRAALDDLRPPTGGGAMIIIEPQHTGEVIDL